MRRMFFALCILCCLAPTAQAQDWTGNLNILMGAKALDEDEWKPVESQTEFGIELDFKKTNWPVSIAIDILGAASEEDMGGLTFESATSEFNLGAKYIWEPTAALRPFFGAGFSFITGEIKVGGLSVDDSGAGMWFGGGAYIILSNHFNLGIEAKYSTAEATFGTADANVGGGHFGFLIGYHW